MQLVGLKMPDKFSQTYLFTVLQLYVLDGSALFLEYLHGLSQRHTYVRGQKHDQFDRESC